LARRGEKFSLAQARRNGPVLAAFFKVSCPVCQLAFPFVERIHQAYGNKSAAIVGISQDSAADTLQFAKTYGLSFPIALDDTGKFPVSNAYRLTHVPSLFWISSDGKIEFTCAGWDKKDMENFNTRAAQAAGAQKVALFKAADAHVPDFKPG
jgi:peroxiredoxin